MGFETIIGHDIVKKQLNKLIDSGMIAHAYIFAGEDGIGKSLIAKTFAINLIGKSEERQYADIIEWRVAKGKKSIGIKEVIDIIKEINKKPYEGDKKVIIIHNAEKMTAEAQNSFLKTVEEPPMGIYIILLCENLENILDTIKSRCQIYKMKRLSMEEIAVYIKKRYPHLNVEESNRAKIFSDGIPGRAEKFLEDEDLKIIRETVIEIFKSFKNKTTSELLEYENFFVKYTKQWEEVLNCMTSYVRDIIIYKETGKESFIINADRIFDVKELAVGFSFNQLSSIIDIINDTQDILLRNVNVALTFDTMILKIQEV